jgi:transcriptional regulator GlxA family with amidase domain
MPAPPPLAVAVVAFDRISPFHLSAPCLVFGDPRPDVPRFDLKVCGAEPGPLTTTAGFTVTPAFGLEELARADAVIVPSWRDPDEKPPPALTAALQAAHDRGAQVVGLCLGAYVPAYAGLLDGRRAATHWAYAEDFARRFPAVRLDPDVLYVEDGRMLTSAGTVAAIDCCLHMLRGMLGAEAANRVARRLVTPPHRQGGQAQFIERPISAAPADARLSGLLDWARARLEQPLTLDDLAGQAGMSRRTFTRRFRGMTGATVGDWLLGERLALAQRLLESTGLSVEDVATAAGFGAASSFRSRFAAAFAVSPTAWRRSFTLRHGRAAVGDCGQDGGGAK